MNTLAFCLWPGVLRLTNGKNVWWIEETRIQCLASYSSCYKVMFGTPALENLDGVSPSFYNDPVLFLSLWDCKPGLGLYWPPLAKHTTDLPTSASSCAWVLVIFPTGIPTKHDAVKRDKLPLLVTTYQRDIFWNSKYASVAMVVT